jgi:hypothetical protein
MRSVYFVRLDIVFSIAKTAERDGGVPATRGPAAKCGSREKFRQISKACSFRAMRDPLRVRETKRGSRDHASLLLMRG